MIESALFESHFDLIPFGIYVVDVKTFRIIYANKVFKERSGACDGKICHRLLYESDRPCSFCKIPDLLGADGLPNKRTIVFEHFNDKEDRWYQLQEKAMSWPDGRIVKYSIAVDISELKETQNRLAEAHAMLVIKNTELKTLSTSDTLTGLYNRLKLNDLLEEELDRFARYGRPFAIIFGDIDHFKAVNDQHGHQVGDAVLKAVAGELASGVRVTDRVGRWGGEEFLAICPETGADGARNLAETLRERIAGREFPGPGRLSMSFGLAVCRPGDDAVKLMSRGDAALYAAKTGGRNRVGEEPE